MPIMTLPDNLGGVIPNQNTNNGLLFPLQNSTTGKKNKNLFDPGIYSAALETSAEDYDKIMEAYEGLLKNRGPVSQSRFSPAVPQTVNYQRTPELDSALSQFKSFSSTGGYSPEDIQNIRARSFAPIRSIYAGAQRNLDRSKALQGGYSPNYAATSAKMARELSEQIGGASTDIEAGIAEKQAQNKLSALSSFAPLAAEETRAQNQLQLANAAAINRVNELNMMAPLQFEQFNQQALSDDFMKRLQAIEGMRGIYGTTPALASTFGNQVLQGQQLKQNDKQISNQKEENKRRTDAGFVGQFGSVPRFGRG